MPEQDNVQVLAQAVREGNRWIYNPPSSEQVAEWFAQALRLPDGLHHEHYINGVTLIPAKEKIKRTYVPAGGGQPIVREIDRQTFTPYVKVETRVAYFWDWCRLNDYVGIIEPVPAAQTDRDGYVNDHLPPGFFYAYAGSDSKNERMIGYSARVTVKTSAPGNGGRIVMQPPPGTKLVPVINSYGKPDPLAMMKAETGAVGRALGMGGYLVLPGSGVATAEDVQEALRELGTDPASEATLEQEAAEAPEPPKLQTASERYADLKVAIESTPALADEFHKWAEERKIDTDDPPAAKLRPLNNKLESMLGDSAP